MTFTVPLRCRHGQPAIYAVPEMDLQRVKRGETERKGEGGENTD